MNWQINLSTPVVWHGHTVCRINCSAASLTVEQLLRPTRKDRNMGMCARYCLDVAVLLNNLPLSFFFRMAAPDYIRVMGLIEQNLKQYGLNDGAIIELRKLSVRMGRIYSSNPVEYERMELIDFFDLVNQTAADLKQEQEAAKRKQR